MPAKHAASTAELIGAIYEAALDSTRWTGFVDKVRSRLDAGLGMLWMHDFGTGADSFDTAGGHISAVAGLDDEALSRYTPYYCQLNVWIANARQLAEGRIVESSSLYPVSRLERTEFYNEWLRDLDLYHGVGSAISRQGSPGIKLTFVRSRRAGPFAPAELRMLGELMPHLRTAIRLHATLDRLRSLSASAAAALDLLPLGVALLTPSGGLLHANQKALELAAGTNALHFTACGGIEGATPAATVLVRRFVDEAMSAAPNGRALNLRVTGPGGLLHVMATPLAALTSPFGDTVPVALFFSAGQGPGPSLIRALRATYGMTSAEAELTQALIAGHTLTGYARARGVSINTAKTQLKFAAARTGVKRQVDLVRVVLTGPAVLARPSIG